MCIQNNTDQRVEDIVETVIFWLTFLACLIAVIWLWDAWQVVDEYNAEVH